MLESSRFESALEGESASTEDEDSHWGDVTVRILGHCAWSVAHAWVGRSDGNELHYHLVVITALSDGCSSDLIVLGRVLRDSATMEKVSCCCPLLWFAKFGLCGLLPMSLYIR